MSVAAISPWSDSNEFFAVFDSIYQNKADDQLDYQELIFGRNKLSIWLARGQQNLDISVNVVATKEIINALIEDRLNSESEDSMRDESAVYSLYALSVIRFCTAISQYSHEDNMKSVRRLAHRYSCPQWIIDCRHNLCHSSGNQPTLEELRIAAMIGLNWLKQYFWLKIVDNYNHRSKSKKNYYKLIDRYVNKENDNNKSRNKVKGDVVEGLRQFANELIWALIKHMTNPVNNDTNPEKSINFESFKVPKFYLKKYSKIFAIVIEYNSLSIVLNLLVKNFDSEDKRVKHLAISWFTSIIKAIEPNTKLSKFKRVFKCVTFDKVMPRIEWIRLLFSLAKRPNLNTPAMIQLIAPIVSDVIPDEKIQLLVNLAKVYSSESLADETDVDTDADTRLAPKTIEDLMSATQQSEACLHEMNETTDWSEVNLGASVRLASVADIGGEPNPPIDDSNRI